MKPDASRLLAVIDRNFAEADSALLKLTAYHGLQRADLGGAATRFFTIARQALYNDMLAGAIRIFDDHKEAGSLWYIIRCNQPAAQRAAQACGIDLDALRKMIPKLRHVRDKIHFHIDRRSVENSAAVWNEAGLSSDTLAHVLRDAAMLLAWIKRDIFGGELARLTDYDGADVQRLIVAHTEAERTARH